MKYDRDNCFVYNVLHESRTNSDIVIVEDCPAWCRTNKKSWNKKCRWKACDSCHECNREEYIGCQDIKDPCSCTGDCGWSSSEGRCISGSTTTCMECPSLDTCIEGTCKTFGCTDDFAPMHTCQCTPECVEFDNCCDDYYS